MTHWAARLTHGQRQLHHERRRPLILPDTGGVGAQDHSCKTPHAPLGDHPTRTGQRNGAVPPAHPVNELSTAQDRHSQVSGPGWQLGALCQRQVW